MARKRENKTGIPDYEINLLAKSLLPMIRSHFEKEETKKEFEHWQAERRRKSS